MRERVVVTGMGVIAPNGVGLAEFELGLRKGRSGVRHREELRRLGFGCQVAGVPEGVDELAEACLPPDVRIASNTSHRYAALAALEAWREAGLPPPDPAADADPDTGAIIGTGMAGFDTLSRVMPLIDAGRVRRVGSTAVEQTMASGVSARVAGLLGLGNQVTTNASACSTGTEALLMGLRHIRAGLAERMLCGGVEAPSPYIWGGFDAMRVLCRQSNDAPARASRPMSASAGGFVPAAGAGLLMLESLDSALRRGARIHAELLGGAANCGGHRRGGSMTAPSPVAVRHCIRTAISDAGIDGSCVDAINGHLTATGADAAEIRAWAEALGCLPRDLPLVTATKSMTGHALSASGAIETIASALMLRGGFVHASLNCEDLHPEIAPFQASIPHETRNAPALKTLVKAGFGFGDVNACLVLRRWARS